MPNSIINILFVGVGGQGTILASKILAEVAQSEGYELTVSEAHGVAGGSLVTQVRMGRKVYSPLIETGQTNIILGFEKIEALRWIHYLKADGVMIINDEVIEPVPIILGLDKCPEEMGKDIKDKVENVIFVNALKAAQECGNTKVSNVVLMGVLARAMEFDKKVWLDALYASIPAKFLELNLKAFEQGWALGAEEVVAEVCNS